MVNAIEFIKWVREKMESGDKNIKYERMTVSCAFGELFEWDKWAQEIPDACTLNYTGTIMDGLFVWHVFERTIK